ncbi:MAG TPA: helix-turn-helix transcriptional regulator [Gemmatimonadota bacterium]|jgi:MerR family transcriptional regulator/heat shock protein HspR
MPNSSPPPPYWTELPGTVPDPGVGVSRPSHDGDRAAGSEENDAPCYVISVAAGMVGLHPQTLRYYERAGLVSPGRTKGNIRLYRRSDIDRLRLVQRLIADHGVNLAGVQVILRMEAELRSLQERVDHLAGEARRS